MNTIKKIMLCLSWLLTIHNAGAQGTISVSNLGQTPTGNAVVANDSWIAQAFVTGTNASGYILNSVQLLMDTASGNPNGFAVSIYSSQPAVAPGNNLVNLSGSDPSAGGVFTYTTSGFTLLPYTAYFVVVNAATSVAQGSYDWSAANGVTHGSDGRWIIEDFYYSSPNGSSWTETSGQDVFQLGIYVTPTPEPSSSLLLFLGGGVFIYVRRVFHR